MKLSHRGTNFFYTYILQSQKDKKLYTGSTNDLKKRLKEHQSGKVNSTKNRRPVKLIYYEACLNEKNARNREKYLKTSWGKRFVNKRVRKHNETPVE